MLRCEWPCQRSASVPHNLLHLPRMSTWRCPDKMVCAVSVPCSGHVSAWGWKFISFIHSMPVALPGNEDKKTAYNNKCLVAVL